MRHEKSLKFMMKLIKSEEIAGVTRTSSDLNLYDGDDSYDDDDNDDDDNNDDELFLRYTKMVCDHC